MKPLAVCQMDLWTVFQVSYFRVFQVVAHMNRNAYADHMNYW